MHEIEKKQLILQSLNVTSSLTASRALASAAIIWPGRALKTLIIVPEAHLRFAFEAAYLSLASSIPLLAVTL